ncbi:hypothetical protein DRP04_00820 [Archaeoglobales archaeon]|nr:MAG: hypothetical protein DRP04_00820 [Archaeoglobales archaeon]
MARRIGGLYFGGDAYVEVADSPELSPTEEITVLARIRLNSLPPVRYYPIAKERSYRFFVDSDGRIYWQLNLNGTWAGNWITSNTLLEVDEWYFIGCTYLASTGTARIFVDGELDKEDNPPTTGDITSSTYPVTIGHKVDQQYYHGLIAHPRIYNIALEQSQIQELKSNPYARVAMDNCVLWLPLTEHEGDIAHDYSGNGNHGTIYNARWTVRKPARVLTPARVLSV